MSVTTASNRVVATGDSATVTFPFNRMLYDATHLEVYLDGDLQVSGYTVAGVPGTSTSITFSVAPVTGVQVLMLRVVPITQLSIYNVGGAFPAATTEKNFDLAVMGLQQFDEILTRAVTIPVESTLTAAVLPDPTDPVNYNKGVSIAGDGSGFDTFIPGTTPFSSVITTKGDIAIFGASAVDRLPVGADDTFIVADSSVARGLKWTDTIDNPIINSPTLSGSVTLDASFNGELDLIGSGQITFPAVQIPSAGANTLDDYEEGNWTPTIGGSATYTVQTGRYTKIGRAVHITCSLAINVLGTGSTNTISGLPFTVNADSFGAGACYWVNGAVSADSLLVYPAPSSTTVQTIGTTAAAASAAPIAIMGNSTILYFSFTYFV